MLSLFNFSSIFPADPICPNVRTPMYEREFILNVDDHFYMELLSLSRPSEVFCFRYFSH